MGSYIGAPFKTCTLHFMPFWNSPLCFFMQLSITDASNKINPEELLGLTPASDAADGDKTDGTGGGNTDVTSGGKPGAVEGEGARADVSTDKPLKVPSNKIVPVLDLSKVTSGAYIGVIVMAFASPFGVRHVVLVVFRCAVPP